MYNGYKVEYLGRIENDFQKSSGIGRWNYKDSVSEKKYLNNFVLVDYKLKLT